MEELDKRTHNGAEHRTIIERALAGAAECVQADMLTSFARTLGVRPVYRHPSDPDSKQEGWDRVGGMRLLLRRLLAREKRP
ncbi:MAG: hypothetical protein PHS73_03765 [Candidatus Peribacteraceae bacterium]|nr:hypothetical protein [Candidatus Peribacteraceae bacterium]